MTDRNIYELVRLDLLAREREDTAVLGGPRQHYEGAEALLDAYDTTIDLACSLRQLIENIKVGDHDVPGYAR